MLRAMLEKVYTGSYRFMRKHDEARVVEAMKLMIIAHLLVSFHATINLLQIHELVHSA